MVKKEEEVPKKLSKAELEEKLIENFINLQKVLTNLSIRFDELSNNMSKLLQLFEISAKSFAEKYTGDMPKSSEEDKEFLKKLDSLLEQNKTIAKGIMMMEEKVRDRMSPSPPTNNQNLQPSIQNNQVQENRFRDMSRSRY